MNKSKHTTIDWYVVFTGSAVKHWIIRLLQPGFKHCQMVREDDGLWLIVNKTDSDLHGITELVYEYPTIRQLCPDAVILPVTTNIDTRNIQCSLGLSSCVDVCKSLLGINKFWIWTPYQLYKYVRDSNG